MPVEQQQNTPDGVEGHANPECCSRQRRFEKSEPLDMVFDVMARQISQPDDREKRNNQETSRGIEERAIIGIKAVHGRLL